MTATGSGAQLVADALARETARYLDVVDLFAALGADPHAAARARAASARAAERAARTHTPVTKRRGVRRWRT